MTSQDLFKHQDKCLLIIIRMCNTNIFVGIWGYNPNKYHPPRAWRIGGICHPRPLILAIPSSSAPCRPSYFPYYSIAWAHASKLPHCLIVPSIAQNTQCISVGLMLKYLHYFMLMWGSDSNWSLVGLPHFWAFLIFMRFKQPHCISKGDQHNIQAVMKLMPSMIEQSSIGTTKKLIQPLYSRRHTSTPWANPKIDHISKFTTLCYLSYICIYIYKGCPISQLFHL